MIRSLRSRLVLAVLAAVAVLLAAFGLAVYAAARWAMMKELEAALASTARALSASVEFNGREVEIEFAVDSLELFDARSRRAYFQFWTPDGKTLRRSPSLKARDLPRFAGPPGRPLFRTLTLPGGKRGLAVGLAFTPRADNPQAAPAPLVTLVIAQDTRDIRRRLALLAWLLAAAGGATMLTATAVSYLAVTRGLKPVRTVAGTIERIDADRLADRVALEAIPTELLPVAQKLNDMLARLEGAFARERAFTADVAHELRTPLAGLRTTVEVALTRPRPPEEYRETLADTLAVLLRAQGMVESLLTLTRLDSGQLTLERQSIDLAALAAACWQELAAPAAARGLTLDNRLPASLPCLTDSHCIRLVLRNLLDNAVTYADPDSTVRLEGQSFPAGVELSCSNAASSLRPDDLPRLFDRFWRGDPSRAGTGLHCGLGLPLVHRALQALGGSVAASLSPPALFTVRLTLPATPNSDPPDPRE